jgi:hypothetical protein
MIKINWDEYKEYKKYSGGSDNFTTLLAFMKSFYNIVSPTDMFLIFQEDEIASMMLAKRNIKEAEDLENFLFKCR